MKKIIDLLTSPFNHADKKKGSKALQSQFDDAVKQVEALMAKGDIKASGEALLKAEALRKQITELNEHND